MAEMSSAPSLTGLSPIKLALLAQQVRAQSEAPLRADPIAIVGMGCRLPGGVTDPEAFWRLLSAGVDAVREVPADRWDAGETYDPDPSVPGKAATKCGGFLDAIDGFDAAFFGIPAREAERMDPQQRVFLEVAIEALDHAGLTRERLAGSRTGVFVASYHNDYAQLEYNNPEAIDARTLTGTVHSVIPNRLSYLLDLRGPSISVDTACSSSLVAIHLACQSLRYGESDIALAGGVSLIISEGLMISLSKVGFMAPDGRCKTFDASADGFGRGEGCGVIVLKRLSDAIADGDRILALIRGSAVNQDGHSTLLAAPNGLAQEAVIREALANAQLEPHRIGYVEAHGTGTALGDPIEVEALAATVGAPAPDGSPCLLGAAKANIGHLEAAAGVAGVIKSVLVFQHDAVPPQPLFKTLNPHISLAGTRFDIPTRLTPWPAGIEPRCIGTSGFGVGGTNAHVILEEAPLLPVEPGPDDPRGPFLLPLSAQSPAALHALAERWLAFLTRSSSGLPALCAAAGQRRSHYDHRFAAVAGTLDELRSCLRAFVAGEHPSGWVTGRVRSAGPTRLAFVFGGQGQQWLGMGRELLATEPVFRDALADIDRRFGAHLSWSLLDALTAPEGRSRLDETEVAQPAIFAIQVALAAQWAAWGFKPDGVVGHSIGEISALQVAGMLTIDDAVRVVAHRGRLMQRATGHGGMAAVALDEKQARELIRPYGARLSVAAINSPRSVVLSGEAAALAEALQRLDERGVAHRRLPVNYAFHSEQIAPLGTDLVAVLGAVKGAEAAIPVYSTVTGRAMSADQIDAEFFGSNVRQSVRFADAIDAMLDDGFSAFLEIGAHPVLSTAIAECGDQRHETPLLFASLRRGRPERESLLLACAGLYSSGRMPDWERLHGGPAEAIDLPSYPWQHERHWLRERPARSEWARSEPVLSEALGRRLPTAGSAVFETVWPAAAPAWVADHRVGGRLILPAMAMLESLRAAAADALGTERVEVTDFVVHQALELDEVTGATTKWQVVAQEPVDGTVGVSLYRALEDTGSLEWKKTATARARKESAPDGLSGTLVKAAAPRADADSIEAFYAAFATLGVAFGPTFRTVTGLEFAADRALASLQMAGKAGAADAPSVHPTLLDGALQASVAAAGGGVPTDLLLPVAVERFRVARAVPSQLAAEIRWERSAGSLRADIVLRDQAGVSIAEMGGVRFVPADITALCAGVADDWLYETVWSPAAAAAAPDIPNGAWLLLSDRSGAGEALAQALRDVGQICRTIAPDDPANRSQFDAPLSDSSWRHGRPLLGVVHLWTLDDRARGTADISDLDGDDERGPVSALHLVQAMARHAPGTQLVLITSGAVAAGADSVARPQAAGLWGFASAAEVEHPELALRVIDLDADAPSVDGSALASELLHGRLGLPRLALRGAHRLRPELRRRRAPDAASDAVRLHLGTDGTLDSLRFDPFRPVSPGPGEIRVRVVAAGINFRDVLLALRMYPDLDVAAGAECAGIVDAVGEGVSGFAVGDRVFGFAPQSLASVVNVPAAYMALWPERFGSLEIAAAQPVAYLTAMYGLQHVANVKAGQRVLIHAAAGGVGLAAVQVAQRAGAEVFATAGSPAKRALLESLGIVHVFDSRSIDFAASIREITAGRGVDIVLNSLAGDFIAASVETLAAEGCFLELGKRGVWTDEEFRRRRPNAHYCCYDLGQAAQADRSLSGSLLNELLASLEAGSLRPLPVRVFEFAQAADAFRLMAQGRHVGKLVLRAPLAARDLSHATPLVRSDRTYWITGGLGALGLHTARGLVGLGARHVVLTSRHEPDERARHVMHECESLGASIHVQPADAGDKAALGRVLDEIMRTLPPLGGVVHAAGALDDGVLMQQRHARFAEVLRGKAHGARILDELTETAALDFFVLYSAAGTLLGPAGQAAYAAANAELDAIAQARRARGLPGLSVAWGLWSDGGMGTVMAASGRDAWSGRGLGWIAPAQGIACLDRLLRERAVQAAVLPIDWSRFLSSLPSGMDPSFFASVGGSSTSARVGVATPSVRRAAEWRALPESQRRGAVQNHILEQALAVLGLDPATAIDPHTPLKESGLDSLMAVELRNLLSRSIGEPLPATLLFDHPSLAALAAYLMRSLKLECTPQEIQAAHAEVAALSDADAEAQLLAELASLDSGRAR
jgi:acyl transferase domain-containing protein